MIRSTSRSTHAPDHLDLLRSCSAGTASSSYMVARLLVIKANFPRRCCWRASRCVGTRGGADAENLLKARRMAMSLIPMRPPASMRLDLIFKTVSHVLQSILRRDLRPFHLALRRVGSARALVGSLACARRRARSAFPDAPAHEPFGDAMRTRSCGPPWFLRRAELSPCGRGSLPASSSRRRADRASTELKKTRRCRLLPDLARARRDHRSFKGTISISALPLARSVRSTIRRCL